MEAFDYAARILATIAAAFMALCTFMVGADDSGPVDSVWGYVAWAVAGFAIIFLAVWRVF